MAVQEKLLCQRHHPHTPHPHAHTERKAKSLFEKTESLINIQINCRTSRKNAINFTGK